MFRDQICFDQGRKLPIPELVPFRLTQTIRAAFGLGGVEGTFRHTCQYVLSVMREHASSLLLLLEPFLYQPLLEWLPVEQRDEVRKRKAMDTDVCLQLFVMRLERNEAAIAKVVNTYTRVFPAIEAAFADLRALLQPSDASKQAPAVPLKPKAKSSSATTDATATPLVQMDRIRQSVVSLVASSQLPAAIEDDLRIMRELRPLLPVFSKSMVSVLANRVLNDWKRLRSGLLALNAFVKPRDAKGDTPKDGNSSNASSTSVFSSAATMAAVATVNQPSTLSTLCELTALASAVSSNMTELRAAIRVELANSKDGNASPLYLLSFVFVFTSRATPEQMHPARLLTIRWKSRIALLSP